MFYSSDGAIYTTIKASRLASIPVWKGNRTLDKNHVDRISKEIKYVKDLNADVFKLLILSENDMPIRYLYDGQHRQTIIKQYFATNYDNEDFDVIISEKICQDESEAIELFKKSNTTKAIQWREDPTLVANTYIDLICKEFNKEKILIKPGKTNRPYLSSDKLREELIKRHVVDWKTTPQEFVLRIREINDQQLELLDTKNLTNSRAKELKFALGMLDFKWI